MPFNNYSQEQQNYIKALGQLVTVFENLDNNNTDLNLIGNQQVAGTLKTLLKDSKTLYEKLYSRKFNVAVVGAENSGKSMLGNKLIGINNLLPTDSLRCTFTVTKALAAPAGNPASGEVVFFKLEEFKERFAEKVRKIAPKIGNVDFQNITWNAIVPCLKKDADKEIKEDIQAILNNKINIENVLGTTKNFNAIALNTPNFQQYITGKDPATNTFNGYPYAVKEVTIWSTQFTNMPDIVFEDVPGFNSTAALHTDQTIEKINEADAVIVIVDFLNGAQVTGELQNIFQNSQDSYGILYTDKVFVFGNKADTLLTNGSISNPIFTAGEHKNALETGFKNAHIAENYFIYGSALYFNANEKSIIFEEKTFSTEMDIVSCLGLTEEVEVTTTDANGNSVTTRQIMGGVQLLIHKLEKYYNEVRFPVLQQRVKSVLDRARKFLEGINITCKEAELNDGGILYYDASENLNNFLGASGQFLRAEIDDININMPFSKALAEVDLTDIFPEQTYDSPILSNIINKQPLNADNAFLRGTVEPQFRVAVFQLFLHNIYSENIKKIQDKRNKIFQELRKLFLKQMGMSEGIPDKSDLEQSVDKLFNDLCGKSNNAESTFNDRGDIQLLLSIFIRHPKNSDDRKKIIQNNIERLLPLANSNVQPAPEYIPNYNVNLDDLKNFFISLKNQGLLNDVEIKNLPLQDWAKKLVEKGQNFNKSNLGNTFRSCMENTFNWNELNSNEKIAKLNEIFNNYIADIPQPHAINSPVNNNLSEETLIKFFNYSDVPAEDTKEAMVDNLNADIQKLRQVFSGPLNKSFNIEKSFISLLIKDADSIRFARNSNKGKEIMRSWVAENIRKIRAADFRDIDKNKKLNDKRNEIAKSIKDALDKL